MATLSANDASLEEPVNLGCPQGGALLPFLWNLTTSYVALSHFMSTAYVENINLATQHKDPGIATNQIQLAVERVSDKFAEVKLPVQHFFQKT
jgi:hypothetical protein